MSKYSLAHLTDSALLSGTRSLIERDRATTAELIAHLAEVDARRLYAPEGYPSMYAWCVGALRFSEDTAYKRIRAARAARLYPAAFGMIADGGLALSGLVLLSAVLTTENAGDLLTASAGRTNEEIERIIVERFPRPDTFAMVTPLPGAPAAPPFAPSHDEGTCSDVACDSRVQLAVRPVAPSSAREERARMVPLSPGRYSLSVTIPQETFDALEYAKSLLGHSVPDGDLAEVLGRSLKVFVAHLERSRFARCARTRTSRRRGATDPRAIPSAVRRMVWERDGGRCTFVGENGTHCECRTRLEFDHIEPVARGGQSTPSNLRLRCRAHNQLAAERAFGREFMRGKREAAEHRAAHERETKRAADARERETKRAAEAKEREAKRAAETKAREAAQAAERERQAALQARRDELVPWLRQLGYSTAASRLASAVCDTMPDATLEDRLRAALRSLMPSSVRVEKPEARGAA